MRKFFRFIFITISIFILLFAAAAIIIPIMYKDKILAVVKTELNENLDAKTDFKDISISLYHNFPHLSVRINDLTIIGKEAFRHDTLIAVKQADLVLDIKKAIKGKYDILKIDLVDPRIHAIVNARGVANWNIVKPTPAAQPTKESPHRFSVSLRHYAIMHGYITYKDDRRKVSVTIDDLVHEGSGAFASDDFTLKTKTSIGAMTVVSGKIPYISKVKTSMDFDIDVDNKNNKYSFDTKDIKVNGLNVSAKGYVQMPDTLHTAVDIQFSTPSNDFKDILSLVPGIYQEDFKDIQTSGKATLSGTIKGIYDQHQVPGFNIDLGIQNGSFQYPGLPQKVSNIQLTLNANNPDGNPDHTVINLSKAHVDFGPLPFDFHLLMKNPVSSQWVEAHAKGRIDLSQLGMFVKLPEGTKISGLIDADVAVMCPMAEVEKKDFDSVGASGTISINNLSYASKDYPGTFNLTSLSLAFDPDSVTVTDLKAQYLNTNFTGEGRVHNLLGYYLHNGILSGALRLTADHIDGNKWKQTFTTGQPKPTTPAPAETPFVAPADLNISFTAQVDEIEYDHVKIKNVQGLMVIGNEIINIQDVQAHALDGDVNINGHYSSIADKLNPDLDFEYKVSLGRLTVFHKHITSL